MYMEKSVIPPTTSVRDRLVAVGSVEEISVSDEFNTDAFRSLSQRLYKVVFERIDLERLQKLSGDQFRRELALLIERKLDEFERQIAAAGL